MPAVERVHGGGEVWEGGVTSSVCSVCGVNEMRERGAALVECLQKIGSRWVRWHECFRCHNDAEARMKQTLKTAERSGV